ncbi:Aldo/keto reductase [Fomitopsis betulina]|nr:Aldo/keto reductase [Fomitopsis betulina]KAI0736734.1 Aldo/keto reductase [Fomitopsis betulina]
MSVVSLLRNFSSRTLVPNSRSIMSSLTITLNDGTKIPWLGYGTGTALYSKDAENAVLQAIQTGVIHLDGAQVYNNEESLGAGIAAAGKPRSELFVTTKLNLIPPGQTVRDTLVASLKKLQTDYVDLFLIHFPINHETSLPEIWRQFEEIQEEGLAKSIGVSNFRVKDLEEILPSAKVIPSVNQIEYHPYVFKADQPVIEYLKKHNITPTSYGGLTPVVRFKGGPVDPVLKSAAIRLSKESGKTVSEGQVLQLWLRSKGIPAITTSSKLERIKEYIAVETLPDLTAEEVKAIDEEGSKTHHRVFVSIVT